MNFFSNICFVYIIYITQKTSLCYNQEMDAYYFYFKTIFLFVCFIFQFFFCYNNHLSLPTKLFSVDNITKKKTEENGTIRGRKNGKN